MAAHLPVIVRAQRARYPGSTMRRGRFQRVLRPERRSLGVAALILSGACGGDGAGSMSLAPGSTPAASSAAAGSSGARVPEGGSATSERAPSEAPASGADLPLAPSAGSAAATDDDDDDDDAAILAPLGPPPTGRTFTLTVNRLGAGSGRVTSSPLGIDCGTVCSASFPEGGEIVLRARPENGSDTMLGDWSLTSCARYRDCILRTFTVDQTVEISFEPMPANVAFLNADPVPTNLGGARAYDAVCNASATRAGLNNLAGDRFVAVVSDATETFRARLGTTASGWVLPDGRPFAGSAAQLFDEQRVYNPLNVTEAGFRNGGGAALVLTNTRADGTGPSSDATCDDFTSLTGAFRGGEVVGGPGAWVDFATSGCGRDRGLLYCMGRDRSADVELPAAAGLRIWLSNEAYHPGGVTPDEHCRAGLPPGVTDARALVARVGSPASAVLELDRDYVRPDGVFVGTGSDITTRYFLTSGIWQQANGTYVPRAGLDVTPPTTWVWTGSDLPTSPGNLETTCADWTLSTGSANAGSYSTASDFFFFNGPLEDCGAAGGGYLYCVEPASPP
ncbi:MAG TPA: hypothetical protein VNN80_04815 [Polyangiaceae bacterium]|nr:hypothetical protein [Polyangiaceae bacterium]